MKENGKVKSRAGDIEEVEDLLGMWPRHINDSELCIELATCE